MKKIEGMDLPMHANFVEEQSTKGNEIVQPKEPYQRELTDSPSIPRLRKTYRKKSITITSKNVK